MRPRYGRIFSALGSVGVTAVAVLGAAGLLPAGGGSATAAAPAVGEDAHNGAMRLSDYTDAKAAPQARGQDEALPAGSGSGKRVVFGIGAQRVWLVDRREHVVRTYLVSGSLTDNLKPGTYEVYSRSRHAIGVDDSGTMEYMVRFAHGEEAAIGFHDIPVNHGRLVQTRAELGTPQSHGCIRQWRPDAKALWSFAPVGTPVVVTA